MPSLTFAGHAEDGPTPAPRRLLLLAPPRLLLLLLRRVALLPAIIFTNPLFSPLFQRGGRQQTINTPLLQPRVSTVPHSPSFTPRLLFGHTSSHFQIYLFSSTTYFRTHLFSSTTHFRTYLVSSKTHFRTYLFSSKITLSDIPLLFKNAFLDTPLLFTKPHFRTYLFSSRNPSPCRC
jgi:hypothetical protein